MVCSTIDSSWRAVSNLMVHGKGLCVVTILWQDNDTYSGDVGE